MAGWVSVTVKHFQRTLISSQVVEVEPDKTFTDLYALTVDIASSSSTQQWTVDEFNLLQDVTNLEPLAQLHNSVDPSKGT
jgi:hypothetical protein